MIEKLGSRIKAARTSAGVRQKVLASGVGISSNYLSLVENDHRTPGLKVIHKIEEYLGLKEGALHTGEASTEESADFDMMVSLVWQVNENKERIDLLTKHVNKLLTLMEGKPVEPRLQV